MQNEAKKIYMKEWRKNNADKVRQHHINEENKKINNPLNKLKVAWRNLNTRCSDNRYPLYHRYGERGIRVEWDNFEDFCKDMIETLPEVDSKYSIERIDNNGNYNKDNCKWSLPIEQANNRVNNIFYEFEGKKQTLAQICRNHGISYKKTWKRIKIFKWPLEKAVMEK